MDDDTPFQKAQTVDPEVRAYVYSLVNALGGSSADDDGRYLLGDDALACLRDLKRWLKLYDEKTNRLDVARCLAEARLVNGDLIPILASWPENDSKDRLKARVALACLELLVPLTWPLETAGEMTVNHHRHTPYLQQAQVLYKAGILLHDTCSILRQVVRIGLPSIALQRDDRTPRDEGIIKLLLYFLRNITIIRQIPNLPSQGLENEVSRSATIEAFRQQDVFALLLTMCSNMGDEFNLQDVIILEILFNLIKGVEVKRLWMTDNQRQGQDVSDLKDVLAAEKGRERDLKKNGPTRHGRFGTMLWIKRADEKMSVVSGQDNLRDGRNAMFNMDKSKKWNKPQTKRKDIDHTIYDFDRTTQLTPHATELLRNFVEEFLDSGFNPLFTHLRKAIEREADRLLDINYRQFFFTVAWFLQAEHCRREKQKEEQSAKLATDFETESYALVAGVLNQETFIMLNRYMQTSFDNKEWQDLNASMRCFSQILLTVQDMVQSPLEEDQEIADNIQNRIFYEETTHDRIFSILKGYKDQGMGYLDACTELSHVFLRMLERYSKENVDLQIRSRRRARKKKKEEKKQLAADANEDVEDPDEESENEDIADVVQVSKERKFDFTRFAAKFTSQSSVDTFVAFTTFYRDLSVDQLKRAHRFFYRVAFKQELAVLLYRVDIVALFFKMIKGPEGLDISHSMHKDWSEFTRQLFKRMFKKMDQRPELVVEMLFSKINSTLYYLEYGQEKQTITSTRAPAELEIKPAPGRGLKEKIGIVIAALQNDDKLHLVQWVRAVLQKAFDERQGWESEAEARREAAAAESGELDGNGTREETIPPPLEIAVRPKDDEMRTAMFKNARLKLLMKLVGFVMKSEEDVLGAEWSVPSALTAKELEESKSIVEEFEKTTWRPDQGDEAPEDLLRRARNVGNKGEDDDDVRRDAFIDDSEGDDGLEEFMFPDNIRSKPSARSVMDQIKAKRKRRRNSDAEPLDDNVLEAQRKAREEASRARREKIKSELYIRDSDDETDEEADREFFRREEEGRKRQDERIEKAMRLQGLEAEQNKGKSNKKRKSTGAGKKAGGKRQRRTTTEDVSAGDGSGDDDLLMSDKNKGSASSPQRNASDTEEEEEDRDDTDVEDTPLSSQSSRPRTKQVALREIRQPRAEKSSSTGPKVTPTRASDSDGGEDEEEEEDEDDEDAPPVSTARRRYLAGFIVDSDDDDE